MHDDGDRGAVAVVFRLGVHVRAELVVGNIPPCKFAHFSTSRKKMLLSHQHGACAHQVKENPDIFINATFELGNVVFW